MRVRWGRQCNKVESGDTGQKRKAGKEKEDKGAVRGGESTKTKYV